MLTTVDDRVVRRPQVLETQNFGLVGRTWLNWRPGGALRWKVKTVGWKNQGVVCEMSTPSRL
jgi:hypothetical protein